MTPKERVVMQQALEALEELFYSNSTKVAVEKYDIAHNALREALEQPDEIDWIETNKSLAKEIIELKKQAEQEPVAVALLKSSKANFERQFGKQVFADWVYDDLTYSFENSSPVQPVKQEPVAWFVQYKNRHEFVFGSKPEFIVDGVVEPLYAAPVRTKDLTDDEIDEIGKSYFDEWSFGFARAVIAADREKNK